MAPSHGITRQGELPSCLKIREIHNLRGSPTLRSHYDNFDPSFWRLGPLAHPVGSFFYWKLVVNIPTQGTKMFLFHHTLKHIKQSLKEWNKNGFGNIFESEREVERKLHETNKIPIMGGFTEERKRQTTLYNRNGTIDVSRRRSSGNRNPE